MLKWQGFKFETRLNGKQLRKVRRFAGACRFVYNKALALCKDRYIRKEKYLGYVGLAALLPTWKQEFDWLSDVPAQALQQSLKDLDQAYINFFKKRANSPVFRKKSKRDSFRIPQGFEVDSANGRVKLPKLGWIRYRKSRDIEGKPKNITVSLGDGKIFISIQTEREVNQPLHPSTSVVGLDWGVKRFYTLSDGIYEEGLAPLKEFLPKLRQLQRRLSRKRRFSKNWQKAKARVAKIHTKIANIRKDFIHKATDEISKNHAVIFFEDLHTLRLSKSVKGTSEKPGKSVKAKSGLNRSILDASPYQMRRQLEYKTQWRGGLAFAVPPRNTSRRCPQCGFVSRENRKTQEKFVCVNCGFSSNADLVGAINIKEAGLALLACSQSSPELRASWQEPAEGICA
jgi:putative transposase